MDLNKIKYYPDRFYICLDGFELHNLTSFITDLNIGQQQSIFIHEYYHYLTNIITYAGVRQFNLNFVDRFKLITIFGAKENIAAFPIGNDSSKLLDDIDYWKNVSSLLCDDDIDYNLVTETEKSFRHKFDITAIHEIERPMSCIVDNKTINGARKVIEIEIDGLTTTSFFLTYGAIDEFLSSAIDEFLFENELSDITPQSLNNRPYYPYRVFEDILKFYKIERPSAFEKIILAYFALNSINPPVKLIEILEHIRDGGYDEFQKDPETYLLQHIDSMEAHEKTITYSESFSKQAYEQRRVHVSQALNYYRDKFYASKKLKDHDFFYFIRPFFINEENKESKKQKFLLSFARILNQFSPPVILKDKQFRYVDKLTTFGEATLLMIAVYEIFESLKTEKYAKRPPYLKSKYKFPNETEASEDRSTFKIPIMADIFQLALNELGLLKIYIDDYNKTQ
jgi:hypothetical protein